MYSKKNYLLSVAVSTELSQEMDKSCRMCMNKTHSFYKLHLEVAVN